MISSVLFFGVLSTTPLCLGQLSSSATITGTVVDASGAVVPQAAIVAVNESTNVRTTTQSNSDGGFVLPGLPVGSYTVTVTKQGFQTYTETGIILHPTLVANVNPVLKVGQVTQEVSVSASAVQVETSTNEVSGEVSGQQAATLPINGRNFQSLGVLMPGVTNITPGKAAAQGGDAQNNFISINGMGQAGTLTTLDGIWNTDAGAMDDLSVTPPPETVEEMRILQNNYSVQYNLYGANVIVLQTKSGTSTFHGNAWEYFRNDALDARNFFSPTVPPLKQNIFGYTFSGPIFIPHHYNTNRQKTFFFLSTQWVRQHMASVVRGADPTAEMRSGIFDTPITNPETGQLFPQNGSGQYQIPSSMLNSSSLVFLNAVAPLPNNPSGGFLNYLNLAPQINKQADVEIKVDHNFSSKLRLMAEYLEEDQTLGAPYQSWLGSPYNTSGNPDLTFNKMAQIQLAAMISPSMVNTTSISVATYIDSILVTGLVKQNQIPGYHQSLPYANGSGVDRLPEIDFAGGWPSLGVMTWLPLVHASDLADSLSDDWSWLRGNHYLQGGMNIVLGTKRQADFAASNGQWFFSGQFTGNAVADFLIAEPASLYQQNTITRPYDHYTVASPYFQDRWKATRRLTLTAGVRFLFEPAGSAQKGYLPIFDPASYNPAKAPIMNPDGTITPTPNYDPLNGIIFNGLNGVPQNLTSRHQYYWAPSAGFAWDIFGDGKTALRGGYGMSYETVPNGLCSYSCAGNYPNVLSLTLITPQFPNALGGTIAPAGAPSMYGLDLDFKSSQIQSYSLGLQHQFGANWFVAITGAGNVVHNLVGTQNINQALPDPPYDFNPIINTGTVYPFVFSPYQGYGGITQYASLYNANWDALEISVRHPVGHNVFLSANYTWQHSLSDESSPRIFQFGAPQDLYHPGNSYGNTGINTPNILGLSAIWSVPWYQNAGGWKGLALGGWKCSDITTIQSGFSLNPGLSIGTKGLATKPDRVSSNVQGPKTVAQWFNTGAFAAPPAGFFGNAAPGSIPGPGLVNFDMAFYKDFRITERQKVEIRGELFNIFNHTNFNAVGTSLGSGTYGHLVGAADPRIVEFVLRYQF